MARRRTGPPQREPGHRGPERSRAASVQNILQRPSEDGGVGVPPEPVDDPPPPVDDERRGESNQLIVEGSLARGVVDTRIGDPELALVSPRRRLVVPVVDAEEPHATIPVRLPGALQPGSLPSARS